MIDEPTMSSGVSGARRESVGAAADSPVIDVLGVHKSFGAVEVLRGCSVAIRRGEVAVICGPSGSGKTTLIKCINGLESFQQGSIRVGDVDVGAPKANLTRLRTLTGMVFQHFELYPHLSVLDNLCLAPTKVLGRSRVEAEAKATTLLERVGLPNKIKAFAAQLSGGQQQRIAIARALAMDPIVMLFDEPTSALDPETIGEVLSVMQELAQDGMTMAVVTHEMGFARRAANRIVFMDEGKVVEDVATESFFASPKSERAQAFLSRILSH